MDIFILSCTPGATDTIKWTDICHGQRGKDFLFIKHEAIRHTSRWSYADNKRPFIVRDRNWFKWGASSTLEGAFAIAKRVQKELE